MSAERAERTERAERRGDVAIIIAVFVVLFGYDVVEAVANLQQLPLVYAQIGMAAATPWAVLVTGLVAPVALFAIALVVAHRRAIVARAAILIVALAVHAQVALLLEQLARASAVAALG